MAAAAQSSNGKKWHDLYPELGTAPVPIDPYIARSYFEKEQERIFAKVWLNIGRIEPIPNPGDYFVKDLAVCKTTILVMPERTARYGHSITCVRIAETN